MPLALAALALAAFGIGTTEFVVMGLLPTIAHDLDVSIPDAGYLVSAYALGVVIGAPLLTLAARRLPAKTTLLSLMGLFTVGNIATALAPDEPVMLVTRFVAGLPHGAFFGVGAVVAAGMVSADRTAKAVSMMFLGLALANIAGVPLGTYLGTRMGWRSAFVVVAVIGVLSVLAIAVLIPRQEKAAPTRARDELAVFRRGEVWLALGTVTVGFASIFTVYSYVAPLLTEAGGFSSASVSWLLVLLGVGMTVGNVIGGRAADRALIPSLYTALAALTVVLVLFALAVPLKVTAAIGLFAAGVAGFSLGPIMQTFIMSKAPDSASLVSASVQSAFNIANSLGAYLGGLTISAGLGYTSPVWLGALLALVGLVMAVVVTTATRHGQGPETLSVRQPQLNNQK
ncbi:MFS transporter [Streptomyces alanosinicus]|uniref:MFS transporter n=1 Tax=Streptomyces alanosinicus TaxID=68171 RepID=A0A918YTR1_9ACTN|nr:MFS transporter [Streptomyces alanosinicus]GHE13605.1 MFS transporter [Streptomyces alanosinicus]